MCAILILAIAILVLLQILSLGVDHSYTFSEESIWVCRLGGLHTTSELPLVYDNIDPLWSMGCVDWDCAHTNAYMIYTLLKSPVKTL